MTAVAQVRIEFDGITRAAMRGNDFFLKPTISEVEAHVIRIEVQTKGLEVEEKNLVEALIDRRPGRQKRDKLKDYLNGASRSSKSSKAL